MTNITVMKPSDYLFFTIQISLMFMKFVLNSPMPLWLVFSPTILIFISAFLIALIFNMRKKK